MMAGFQVNAEFVEVNDCMSKDFIVGGSLWRQYGILENLKLMKPINQASRRTILCGASFL